MKNATLTKAFSFSISPEVFARIKRITDNEQTSMAEWVRDAIDSALNNIKREEDTM
jgi:predicted DNA-binding protein